jgi:predicted transposase YbfD/YdcC
MTILGIIEPKSLNECFMKWVKSILPESLKDMVIAIDGKTIRSTAKISSCTETVHMVSAHIANLGITIGQVSTNEKSNEIPAVRELIRLLDIEGCIVVADALNCQKKTCQEIINAGADYVLVAKENQKKLMKSIEAHIFDEEAQAEMDYAVTLENNKGRLEQRRAFTSTNVDVVENKSNWPSLSSVGAINRQVIRNNKTSDEWHFYISSRQLTAQELLKVARDEWSVESMHWLLDVHYKEDFCRVADVNTQKNMNIIRKLALNIIKDYKQETGSKAPLSNLMLDCLVDQDILLKIIGFS